MIHHFIINQETVLVLQLLCKSLWVLLSAFKPLLAFLSNIYCIITFMPAQVPQLEFYFQKFPSRELIKDFFHSILNAFLLRAKIYGKWMEIRLDHTKLGKVCLCVNWNLKLHQKCSSNAFMLWFWKRFSAEWKMSTSAAMNGLKPDSEVQNFFTQKDQKDFGLCW